MFGAEGQLCCQKRPAEVSMRHRVPFALLGLALLALLPAGGAYTCRPIPVVGDATEDDAGGPADAGSPGDGVDDLGRGDTGGGDPCHGFSAEAVTWAVPDARYAYNGMSRLAHTDCGSPGDTLHVLRDMDGDEAPDLLVYYGCDASEPLGRAHWLVHRNTGSGFAAEPIVWPLPAGYGLSTFRTPENTDCALQGDHLYALRDLDGDRAPELVVYYGCDASAPLGRTHWLVHHNTGAGFAAAARTWALPPGYGWSAFVGIDNTDCQLVGDTLYTLRDMDGDRAPDLLVHYGCDPAAPLGESHWLVHANTGAGFRTDAEMWDLPEGYGWSAFTHPENAACQIVGDTLYALRDMDGDETPELLVYSGCDPTAPLGVAHWRVHANEGDGFAGTAAVWALPQGYGSTTFRTLSDDDCDTWGDILHRLVDIDGDRRPDLVLYSDCDPSLPLGFTHWAVHRNAGDGFSGQARAWCLPDEYESGAFSRLADADCDTWGDTLFAARDLDGDRALDLVVHSDCEPATPLGADHWLVHRGPAAAR